MTQGRSTTQMEQSPLLRTEREEERVAAVHGLAAQGAIAVPQLVDQLGEPSWSVRRAIVAAILRIGAASVAPLCAQLRTRRHDEAMIAATVDAIVGLDADVHAEVEKLARDPDPAVVADAAQILGRRRDESAVPLLRELVLHEDDNVAVAAVEALGRIGGANAVDTLVKAVKSASFFRVFPAVDVLGRSGDPRAVAPLSALLADPMYAAEAARALGRTGQIAAVAPLCTLIADSSESQRRVAAMALMEIAVKHRAVYGTDEAFDEAVRRAIVDVDTSAGAVPRLCHALHQADEQEHLAIIAVLAALGGEPAVACLTSLLVHADVAAAAALALRKLGKDSERSVRDALARGGSGVREVLLPTIVRASAVDELVRCLQDADAGVRSLACDALARVGATGAAAALFSLLADESQRVQQAAVTAIQSLGSNETKTLALREARSENARVRRLSLRVLGYFGFSEALPVFIDASKDDDARIREAALLGLALVEEPAALDALVDAIAAPDDKTRAVAARALGHRGKTEDARVVNVLLRALGDADAWVRYYACQALGRLHVEAAVDDVTKLLRDDAGQVRVAAVEALAHLRSPAAFAALKAACEGAATRSGSPSETDHDDDVQRAALLGISATRMTEGLEVLLRAAGSPNAATRLIVISAIGESDHQAALPTLAAAARDPDENVRDAAFGFLARRSGKRATSLLLEKLHEAVRDRASPAKMERITAALATPSPDHVEGILAALHTCDEQDALATLLVSCLARQRTPLAEAGIVRALSSDCVAARKAAASALGNIRTTKAMAALQHAARVDADGDVRRICHVLVGQ